MYVPVVRGETEFPVSGHTNVLLRLSLTEPPLTGWKPYTIEYVLEG